MSAVGPGGSVFGTVPTTLYIGIIKYTTAWSGCPVESGSESRFAAVAE
jgi:hypothetical protein